MALLVGALSPQGGGGMTANVAVAARVVAVHRATRDRRDGNTGIVPRTLVAAPFGSMIVSGLNTIAISNSQHHVGLEAFSGRPRSTRRCPPRGERTYYSIKRGGVKGGGAWLDGVDGCGVARYSLLGGRESPPPVSATQACPTSQPAKVLKEHGKRCAAHHLFGKRGAAPWLCKMDARLIHFTRRSPRATETKRQA